MLSFVSSFLLLLGTLQCQAEEKAFGFDFNNLFDDFDQPGVATQFPFLEGLVDLGAGQKPDENKPFVTMPKPPTINFNKPLCDGAWGWVVALSWGCDDPETLPSIVENLEDKDKLTTLVAILSHPSFAPVHKLLSNVTAGPFTLFAPTNKAFEKQGIVLEDLDLTAPATVEDITAILSYHVLPDKHWVHDLSFGEDFVTLQGETVRVARKFLTVKVNGIQMGKKNILSLNGIIHIIKGVLVPPSFRSSIVQTAVATESLSALVTVLINPDYEPILNALTGGGPFTVFAPVNKAFNKTSLDLNDVDTVTEILKYHVVAGNYVEGELTQRWGQSTLETLQGDKIKVEGGHWGTTLYINRAKVLSSGILCSNGVVYLIDGVLIPKAQRPTIVQTAINTPVLSTLVTVLTLPEYAPVLEALSGEGPFTVFAPTDEAFAAADLDLTDVAAVTDLLKYHVVAGKYPLSKLKWAQLSTLNGNYISSFTRNKVNEATIIRADIMASNGVIHIIDEVLDLRTCANRGQFSRHGVISDLYNNGLPVTCRCEDGRWNCDYDIDGIIDGIEDIIEGIDDIEGIIEGIDDIEDIIEGMATSRPTQKVGTPTQASSPTPPKKTLRPTRSVSLASKTGR